jgi:phosphatidylinositol alpha-mannosyltransferase
VLHVQVPYSPFLAGRIIKAAPRTTAIVGTFHVAPHSTLVTLANRLLRLMVARSFKRFDAMIGAPAAADFAKRTFGVESIVIPLPLKLDPFFDAEPFEEYTRNKTVMFLGRLVERKGCQHLLEAVNKAASDGDWPGEARVVICGGGPLEAELKEYVTKHQLADLISFTGYITEEDKPRCLASADVVTYPSTGGESFGIVLLEAMAAANGPVLAGDNPGYASVLGKRPQQLFDPKDTAVFASKIVTALQDDDGRAEARAWQHDYVRQFDIASVGPQIVAVYDQALQRHPR